MGKKASRGVRDAWHMQILTTRRNPVRFLPATFDWGDRRVRAYVHLDGVRSFKRMEVGDATESGGRRAVSTS